MDVNEAEELWIFKLPHVTFTAEAFFLLSNRRKSATPGLGKNIYARMPGRDFQPEAFAHTCFQFRLTRKWGQKLFLPAPLHSPSRGPFCDWDPPPQLGFTCVLCRFCAAPTPRLVLSETPYPCQWGRLPCLFPGTYSSLPTQCFGTGQWRMLHYTDSPQKHCDLEDVFIRFTREEWDLLNESQKRLYHKTHGGQLCTGNVSGNLKVPDIAWISPLDWDDSRFLPG